MKIIGKTILGLSLLGAVLTVSAEANFSTCAGCHGVNAEKKALGKSQIIQGWKSQKIVDALNGYKNGTYGGMMKGVMKGQVMSLSDADIQALAKHIEGLKK